MNVESRFYADDRDLYAMQALNQRIVAEVGYCGQLHMGEIPHMMFNGLRRYDVCEIVLLWEDANGDLLAWSLASPNRESFEFQILPQYHNTALEKAVYDHTIALTLDRMAAEGKDLSVLSAEVFAGDMQRKKMLEARGFVKKKALYQHTECALMGDLPQFEPPDGFIVRSCRGEDEAEALVAVHSGSFGSTWTIEQYLHVIQSPGYDAERELVVEAPDGRLAAFCIIWPDSVNCAGLFEPVGTHKDFWRRGLARAMMSEGMQRLQAMGMEQAIVLHEVDNVASTNLYASMGFKKRYIIYDYVKVLE